MTTSTAPATATTPSSAAEEATLQCPALPQPPTPPPSPSPGPGALHITWKPNGPAATRWKIGAYRVGRQGIGTDPDNDDSPITADPAAGVTITGLAFNTEYLITIQGINRHGTGTAGADRETTGRAAVELVALEVTQGLQNWQGDITLVKGKRTVVRAFLEPTNNTDTTVNVELFAVSDGAVVATMSSPLNKIGGPPSEANHGKFTARRGAAADRAMLDASANFRVGNNSSNSDDWVGNPDSRANPGDPRADFNVTYRVVVPQGVLCDAAAAEPDNTVPPGTACKVDLDFVYVNTPTVRLVGVGYDDGTGHTVVPTRDDLSEQARRIMSLMPIPALDYQLRILQPTHPAAPVLQGPNRADPLLNELLLARANDGSTRVYLGVLLGDPPAGSYAGLANDFLANVAVWYLGQGTETATAGGYPRNRGAHEFGHVLGEYHTEDKNRAVICSINTPSLTSSPSYPEYPHVEMIGGEHRALLGPLGDRDTRVWGFDTRFVDPGNADWLAVLNPDEVFAVMSYCFPTDPTTGDAIDTSQARWVDVVYHQRFIDSINGISWSLGPVPGSTGDPASVDPAFSGVTTIAADGTVRETVVLPVFEVPSTTAASHPQTTGDSTGRSGRYLLELLDAHGVVLRSVSFHAATTVGDIARGARLDGATAEVWIVQVSDPPDYSGYRITRADPAAMAHTVAQGTRSPSAPTVSVTAPTVGQVVTGPLEVAWSASDPDGDELSYLVEYSTNGGTTYETIAVNHTATSIVIGTGQVAGSPTAVVRVTASDGLRTAAATSPVFTLTKSAPHVSIHSPSQDAVHAGLATIVLDASAYDPEDHALGASAISWSSDIDGQLATTAVAIIDTATLTAGTHVLTATATDSDGTTASASVTVTIKETSDPPFAADDTAYIRSGTAVVDVAANDTDAEGDINPNTVRVLVPPSRGNAQAAGRGIIDYRADVGSYDTLVYEICDRARQCAKAESTVIATNWQ